MHACMEGRCNREENCMPVHLHSHVGMAVVRGLYADSASSVDFVCYQYTQNRIICWFTLFPPSSHTCWLFMLYLVSHSCLRPVNVNVFSLSHFSLCFIDT
jgi:hypothetical protein